MAKQRDVIVYFLMFLLATILLIGCEVEEPAELRYFENPENVFPCWRQSWKDGDWMPLAGNPELQTYYECEAGSYGKSRIADDDNRFYMSLCTNTLFMRIINPDDKTERTLENPLDDNTVAQHEWTVATSSMSRDLIREGDILFIFYKSRMYAVSIDKIYDFPNLDENKIRIKIADVTTVSEKNGNVDLKRLKWKKEVANETINFSDRYINISMSYDLNDEKVLYFEYDYLYGDSKNLFPPVYTNTEPAHIAIVNKDYLNDNEIVDLTKFYFKTWEDGLGNRCAK